MEQRVIDLLTSQVAENYSLGLSVCRAKYPHVWAALLGYSGPVPVTEDVIKGIMSDRALHLGANVRMRGLDSSPVMVVTNIEIKTVNGLGGKQTYYTNVKCKWYNKSTQSFSSIDEKLECLEVIEPKKQQ